MKCQNCGENEANVHYTSIVNGVKKEYILCSECADKMNINSFNVSMNFESLLGDFFNSYAKSAFLPSLRREEMSCNTCNMLYSDYSKEGMFGCQDCYEEFSDAIDSLLKNVYATNRHIGRASKHVKDNKLKTETVKKEKVKKDEEKLEEVGIETSKEELKLAKLKKDLKKAISEENYEEAAKLRDEIKEIEG